MISRKEFIDALFPDLPDDETYCVFPEYGRKRGNSSSGLRMLEEVEGSWMFCVSSVKHQGNGFTRSTLEHLRHAYVLVCDDIGTKSSELPVEPSYKLETSAGNFQWGYRIEPFNVSTAKGAGYFDGCLLALAQAGYNDPGCRGAQRVVRMPTSIHKDGVFKARIADWHPERVWSLKNLMREIGVKPQRVTTTRAQRGSVETLGAVDDAMLTWLESEGMLKGGHNDSFVFIHCPWVRHHTTRTAQTATGYSPLNYGHMGRQFKCQHGHCSHRSFNDLLQWAIANGFDASGMQAEEITLHDISRRFYAIQSNNR